MINSYLPVLVILVLSVLIGGVIILLSTALSRGSKTAIKLSPYECGMDPIGGARSRFSVRFFLMGMLFIVFDIELIFLFPWATVYYDFIAQGLGLFAFMEMFVFVVILLVGLIYVWKKGALEWQ